MEWKKYDKPKSKFATLELTESVYGKEALLEIDLHEGEINIFNGCIMKFRDKRIVRYSNGGCAMKIKKVSSTKTKYFCNDFDNDVDFDDLVFEMEILD